MKKIVLSGVALLCMLLIATTTMAQVSRGTVTDQNNQPLIGVSVVILGTFTGTATDASGNFQLNLNFDRGPVTLVFTYIGYEEQRVVLSAARTDISVKLKEQSIIGNEVIVSASRVAERILEAPVTVTQIQSRQIQAGSGPELFSNLARYQGVDVNSSSMLLTTISTRGFNSPKSERMIQLADYVDLQVPSLNLNLGNMLGVAELDINSVEIIHGPASALYGANAFNGVLITNSKDPFIHQGIGLKIKGGSRELFDGQIRVASKIGDRFAFKINASYLTANDWVADDFTKKRITSAVNNDAGSPFGFDALNKYGEISSAQAGVTIVPGQVIYTPGWAELALIEDDEQTRNLRFHPSISVLLTDKLKATVDYRYSKGQTTYQSTSRYRFKDLSLNQFRAELKTDKWFIRGFRTEDNGGDTYDLSFLGARMATLNPTTVGLPPLPGNAPNHAALFFGTYGAALQQGATPAQAYAAAEATWPKPAGGTFNRLRQFVLKTNQPQGSRLPVNSIMSDISGQYLFTPEFATIIIGGSYRDFSLASSGAVFEDRIGGDPIKNYEYGGYAQITKTVMDDKLKLQLATRVDNFKFFDAKVSPRASAVYTFGDQRQNNFRASYGTAFRSPTQIDQFIRLDIGSALLLGNVRPNGFAGYQTRLLTQGNPNANIGAVAGGSKDFDYFAPKLDLEQVNTFEIGYKTIIDNKLIIDLNYYRSNYDNFIGAQPFVGNTDGTRPTVPQILVAVGAAPGTDGQTRNRLSDPSSPTRIIQVWFNNPTEVTTQGASIALGYTFDRAFTINTNYSFNKIGDLPPGFLSFYNTPKNKFNVGAEGEFKKLYSYSINYRWQESFTYEFPFDIGPIENIGTLDASFSVRMPRTSSTLQIGGSNLTNAYNKQIWGGPQLGRLVYGGITFDIK